MRTQAMPGAKVLRHAGPSEDGPLEGNEEAWRDVQPKHLVYRQEAPMMACI